MPLESCESSAPPKSLLIHHNSDRGLHQSRVSNPSTENVFRQTSFGSGANPSFNAFLNGGPILPDHVFEHGHRSSERAQPPDIAARRPEITTPAAVSRVESKSRFGHFPPPGCLSAEDRTHAHLLTGDFRLPGAATGSLSPTRPSTLLHSASYTPPNFERQTGVLGHNQGRHRMPLGVQIRTYRPGISVSSTSITPHDLCPPLPEIHSQFNGGFVNLASINALRQAADEEFKSEMDSWMALHGAPSRQVEDVDAIMEELASEMEANSHTQSPDILRKGTPEEVSGLDMAMEQIAQELELAGHQLRSRPELGHPSLRSTDSQHITKEASLHEPIDGSPESVEFSDSRRQGSSVSAVAKSILESVHHEQGDKWKNSAFLALMRDFRDGRKDVVKDCIQEAVPAYHSSRTSLLHSLP